MVPSIPSTICNPDLLAYQRFVLDVDGLQSVTLKERGEVILRGEQRNMCAVNPSSVESGEHCACILRHVSMLKLRSVLHRDPYVDRLFT